MPQPELGRQAALLWHQGVFRRPLDALADQSLRCRDHTGLAKPQPPVLYLCDPNPVAVRVPESDEEQNWVQLLKRIFDLRCTGEKTHCSIDLAAEGSFGEFDRKLQTAPGVPAGLREHLVWLPELAERIAAILAVLENLPSINPECAARAIAVTRWLGRQHLKDIGLQTSAATAAPADISRAAEVMLEKIRGKGPLSRRELRRSYNNPDPAWFVPTLESLLKHQKIRASGENRLEACDSAANGSYGGGSAETAGFTSTDEEGSGADSGPKGPVGPADTEPSGLPHGS